jgi:galactokinase
LDAPTLRDAFKTRFGRPPRLFRAPGRVNLIGEHTDYSGGFAMPCAIDKACLVAAAPNGGDVLRIASLVMEETAERPLESFAAQGRWSDYPAGVAAALQESGVAVSGAELLICSDVPLGAGVSSSAALEVAVALALAGLAGAALSREDLARLAWRAETGFVGAPCGPLDQFASVFGAPEAALVMDCRSLTAVPVPFPQNLALLVIESGVRHAVRDGGYPARRADCEAAADALGVSLLRDADPKDLGRLSERLRRRARHVLSENARVLAAAEALKANHAKAFGALMKAAHESLRDDFEATCPETDILADLAARTDGVFGARQMGGGFGGCVLALTEADKAEAAAAAIVSAYPHPSGRAAPWFVCRPAGGAAEIIL